MADHNRFDWMGINKKAIAILRVSTKRQEEGVSHSLQEELVKKWATDYGLELVVEPFKIAESAKDSENRKKYHRAIEWALKNGVRHILFYMGDREARNLTDNEHNEKLVLQDRIVIHYVRENKILHKGSSESDFTARDYQAVGNKDFSRRLRVKVNDAMRRKAENGWFPSNHPPLGYIHQYELDSSGRPRKRGTTLVRNPDDRIVKMVIREFELCADGYSVAAIREQIIREGFVVPSSVKKYSKHGIEERLKNKFYRGKFDWQGVEYAGRHEIIIPKAMLEAVDGRFGHRKVRRRESMDKGIFSGGWLRCGHPECGMQICCEHTKKKIKATGEQKEFRYYRCTNSRGVHKSMRGQYISEEALVEKFEPALDKVTISAQRAQEIAHALNEADGLARQAIDAELVEYGNALHKLQDRRSKVIDLYADGNLSADDYGFKIKQIEMDMRHYTKLQAEAQFKISDAWKVTAETVLELAKDAKQLWKQGTLIEKLEILKKVCWNPILEGANLRYDLRKPFATLAEMNGSGDWRPLRDSNSCLLRERELS